MGCFAWALVCAAFTLGLAGCATAPSTEPKQAPSVIAATTERLREAHAAARRFDLVAASAQYQRLLPVLRTERGSDHPSLAETEWRYARVLGLRGELGLARHHAQAALARALRIWGPRSPATARVAATLAEIAQRRGDPAEARRLTHALASWVDENGGGPELASGLAVLEARLGSPESAERRLRLARARAVDRSGPDSLVVAAISNDLAETLILRGRPSEAVVLAEASVARLTHRLGARSVPTALARDTLGWARVRAGEHGAGRDDLEACLAILAPRLGRDAPLVIDALDHHREALDTTDPSAARHARERVEAALRRRAERFGDDPDASAEAAGVEILGQRRVLRSKSYGYALELSGADWTSGNRAARDLALAELGAAGPHAGVATLPVSRPPGVVAERVLRSLLALIAGGDRVEPRSLRHRGLPSLEIELDRVRDGRPFRYRARAVAARNLAVLVVAWSLDAPDLDLEPALSAVGGLQLEPDAVESSAASGMTDRVRQAAFWNELALAAARPTASDADLLARAVDAAPDDPRLFENWIRVLLASSEEPRVLDILGRRGAAYPDLPVVHALQSVALARLGRLDEALLSQRRALDLGVEDPGFLVHAAGILGDLGREGEALALLERHAGPAAPPTLERMRSKLLRQTGDPDAAIAVLIALEARTPDDPGVVSDLFDAYVTQGSYRAALELIDRAETRFGPSAELLAARARAQLGLGRVADASDSISRALALEPDRPELARLAAWIGGFAHAAHPTAAAPAERP